MTQDNFGTPGFVGYRVAPTVQNHSLFAGGVYTFFRDHEVNVTSTIVAGADAFSPLPPGINIVNAVNVHLNGLGHTSHVVNQLGAGTNAQAQISYKC